MWLPWPWRSSGSAKNPSQPCSISCLSPSILTIRIQIHSNYLLMQPLKQFHFQALVSPSFPECALESWIHFPALQSTLSLSHSPASGFLLTPQLLHLMSRALTVHLPMLSVLADSPMHTHDQLASFFTTQFHPSFKLLKGLKTHRIKNESYQGGSSNETESAGHWPGSLFSRSLLAIIEDIRTFHYVGPQDIYHTQHFNRTIQPNSQ